MRSLPDVEAEIEQVVAEWHALLASWQTLNDRDPLAALASLPERRERMRVLERRLTKLWAEKRFLLAGYETTQIEGWIWRLARAWEIPPDDEIPYVDSRAAPMDSHELGGAGARHAADDAGTASRHEAHQEL